MPCAQVSFQGNGPLANLQAIADASGLVKGKVGNPHADPPLRPDGKLDVGAAVGRGVECVQEKSAGRLPSCCPEIVCFAWTFIWQPK